MRGEPRTESSEELGCVGGSQIKEVMTWQSSQ
jgi:hypothetical protein